MRIRSLFFFLQLIEQLNPDRRNKPLIPFLICFLLCFSLSQPAQPVFAASSEDAIPNHSANSQNKQARPLSFENRNDYSPAQLFLLSRELLQNNNIQEARTALKLLEKTIAPSVKPIVSVEQINVYLKKQDLHKLLLFLVQLAKSTDSSFYEKIIFGTLKEHYNGFPDRVAIQKTLSQLLPVYHEWHQDPELITWMINYTKPGDSIREVLMGNLWAFTDVEDFPPAYTSEIASLVKNPDRYPELVKAHFKTQYRLRNWTYTINQAPGFLSRIETGTPLFKSVRDIWFKAFFRKRQYSLLIELLNQPQKAASLSLDSKETANLLFRLWLKKGFIKEARKQLTFLEKAPAYHRLGARYFELAEFYFSRNRFKESLPYYLKITAQNSSEGLIPLVQWRKLWAYYRLQKKEKMHEIVEWANRHTFESREVAAKFCYWSVKLNLFEKRHALSCYQEYPLTYYGFRSLQSSGRYTGIEKTMLTQQAVYPAKPLTKSELELLELVHTLYLAGYTDLTDLMVMEMVKTQPGLVFFRHLANILFKSQRYYTQQLLVELYFKKTLNTAKSVHHPLLPIYYPAAYHKEVNRHIGDSNLSRMLAFAVMREESNFRPEVESPAGAVGLMQLMPSTARYVAKTIRTPYQPDLLVHPDFNVKLGTAYLKRLLRRYKGNLFYTLAAYNGGATNVKRWRKKAHSTDYDVFVETITYLETQNYVKRVIRSYYIYQLLYGKKAGMDSRTRFSSSPDRVPDDPT